MTARGRYRLADLSIDFARQRVERDGEPLSVVGLSFQLLRYMIEQGDRVIGFDELIEKVWAPAVVNEETVTQRAKLLRQALGDDVRDPRYLRSVRGRGYQLCAIPQLWAEEPPGIATRERRPWMAASAAATILIGAAGGMWWWQTPQAEQRLAIASHTQSLTQRAEYYAALGQRENNERAIALYQQALLEKPTDTAATIGLSRAYSARVCLFNFPAQWAERAQALAEGAIAKAPGNSAAHAAAGYSHDCRGHLDAALAAYERAVELDPTADASRASAAYLYDQKGRLADALIANTSLHGDPARVRYLQLQIADNLDRLGYLPAAEERYRRSFRLYPDNVFSNIAWPRFLFRHGRLSEARAALTEAMSRGTDHIDLHLLAGELALMRGDRPSATAAFQKAVELRPQASWPATMLRLSSESADPRWARERAAKLSRDLKQGVGSPSDWLEVALLQMAAGDRTAALSTLQHAVAEGYSDAAYLRTSPWFRQLDDDPAFDQAIDAIQARAANERDDVPAALLAGLTASP
jgi:DNA-binding winged helix-turn-helix (wHTH) protein/tetratricopeptide (TPR) repeat protein